MLQQVLLETKYKPPAVMEGALQQKLQAAKEFLGKNWILHPEYKFNPKHRFYDTDN